MTYKVGTKGQVVLPKAMRQRLGIHPGDQVRFDEGDQAIRVRKAESKSQLVERLRGSLGPSELDPLELLTAERRRDREREERKLLPPA